MQNFSKLQILSSGLIKLDAWNDILKYMYSAQALSIVLMASNNFDLSF